jgi:oligopeptidase F. Metallo peptidase. MEROPS family M03B
MSSADVPEREEIDEEYTWDLESLFTDDEAWEEAFEETGGTLADLQAYEGRATESAATLRELLETYETVMRAVSNVSAYARMRKDEDTRDDDAQAMAARAQSLSSRAQSAASSSSRNSRNWTGRPSRRSSRKSPTSRRTTTTSTTCCG